MRTAGPNPFAVLVSVLKSMTKRRPRPTGTSRIVDDSILAAVLEKLQSSGVPGLAALRGDIDSYRQMCESVEPDELDAPGALAFWINLYNAGALDLAARAHDDAKASVLRVPAGFTEPWATVAGEKLSLDNIEHGKIRRFHDPRVHGALICGSASCPTLRYEPFSGEDLDRQLDDQLRSFFAGGGVAVVTTGGSTRVLLSRMLLWFGTDFVRPRRMPTFIPSSKKAKVRSVHRWLPDAATEAIDAGAKVEFQPYDWSLSCSIG